MAVDLKDTCSGIIHKMPEKSMRGIRTGLMYCQANMLCATGIGTALRLTWPCLSHMHVAVGNPNHIQQAAFWTNHWFRSQQLAVA